MLRSANAIRIPISLAALLVTSELLGVLSVGFAVDTEARLRATVAAGETVAAAIAAYEQRHGQPPDRIDQLVPMYLRSIPRPVYGDSIWSYEARPVEAGPHDGPRGIVLSLDGHALPLVRTPYALSVRLDGGASGLGFRRLPNGCWRLPEAPGCW